MVDNILKHDRNYNTAVTTVSEKETTKEVIQNEIKALELSYKELNNKSNIKIKKQSIFLTL
jgi:hypothetical protein